MLQLHSVTMRGREDKAEPEVARLLFDLASNDRLALLTAVSTQRYKATQLAPSISASIQEASKHLARLQESGLVDRDREGYYQLTVLGRMVMQLLPSFRFLTEHRDYFLAHDLMLLPPEFVSRIGELSNCELYGYTGRVLEFYEEVVSNAQERISVMMDHQIRTNMTIAKDLAERRVAVRYMVPLGTDIRKDFEEARHLLGELLEVRLSSDIHVGILLDEERAGVAFPDLSGQVDYNRGFRATDLRAHRWCEDLFEVYWRNAKRVVSTGPVDLSPHQTAGRRRSPAANV